MAKTSRALHLTGNPDADALLSRSGNALLIAMVLDQQVAMEKAFSGPQVIAERMGGTFDVAAIAALSEEDFVQLCSQRPAIHRFPGAMAQRIQEVCRVLVADYSGDAKNLWSTVGSGAELRRRLLALPGFGAQKTAIFTALLAKQWGVRPSGWQEVAGEYGDPGVYRSVADIIDEESLTKVRETKRSVKAAKRSATPS